MYDPGIFGRVANIPLATTYLVVSYLTALLCFIELVRIARMTWIMVKEKLQDKEPIIYNCLLMAMIILAILGARCVLSGRIIHMTGTVHVAMGALTLIPAILFIYLIRVMGKLVWMEDICVRYNLRDKGISKRSKNYD